MIKSLLKKIPGIRSLARKLGFGAEPPRQFLLAHLPKHSVGAEIGVDRGDFSAQLLKQVQPAALHLIDPWEYHGDETYSAARYGGKAQSGQAQMDARFEAVRDRFAHAKQVTVHRAYSTGVLNTFPDAHLDWVYIDGNHMYEYVKADLELSLQKTKVGGLILGDDYGVVGWWDDGVKKAVDEFRNSASVELIEIRSDQFIFRKVA